MIIYFIGVRGSYKELEANSWSGDYVKGIGL